MRPCRAKPPLSRCPRTGLPPLGLASSRAVRPMAPFVGRPSEMAQLEVLWSRAARGQGTIVLISGNSGIGKSRLAGELAYLAEAQGGRVLLGSTTPHEPVPYQPFVAALRAGLPLLRAEGLSALTLSALATLVPEIGADRSDLPALAPLDASHQRTRLFRSLLEAVAALARTRPLLLLLEDLHWAGASTVDLLEFLAASLQRTPVPSGGDLSLRGDPPRPPAEAAASALAAVRPFDPGRPRGPRSRRRRRDAAPARPGGRAVGGTRRPPVRRERRQPVLPSRKAA